MTTETTAQHGTASRYVLGCRCDECRDAACLRNKVYNRARNRAAQEFRLRHETEWQRFLDEEYERLGLERKRPGRPANPDSPWSWGDES